MLKVFLGGEGNNDIGTRWYRPMGGLPGVIEVLLRKVRATGWHVAGARSWQSIRKYRAGGALGKANHGDARNVLGLVLHAYEDACEMLAFVRDHDGDDLREQEIHRILDGIAGFGFARTAGGGRRTVDGDRWSAVDLGCGRFVPRRIATERRG